jgi:MFS family permease
MDAASMPSSREQRLLPLLAWATGATFFFYAWVLRVAPSVMVEELMRDFAVGAGVLGHLSAAYFYGYAGMQIPVGLLLDRFGPRRLMTVAALICAGGCVLFATGNSLATVTAGRFLIGASAAFSLVGAMAIAGQWFPANRFAMFSGLAMAMGMAGGIFGQAPLRLAIEASDWRAAMLLLATGGAILAVAAWATVRDKWHGSGGMAVALSGLGKVIRHRQTLLIALTGLGTSAPLLAFAGLWGVPFLETAYGMSRSSAAGVTSTFFAGWGIGAPLFGWLSDRIGRRRDPLLIALAFKTVALAVLIYVPGLPLFALVSLSFLVGLFGSAQILCFALVRENHTAALSGTAIGFLNAVITGAGALFQPLVGVLLDLAWTGETAMGAPIYHAEAYRLAFASLIACCVGGFLCLLAVRETHCRPQA